MKTSDPLETIRTLCGATVDDEDLAAMLASEPEQAFLVAESLAVARTPREMALAIIAARIGNKVADIVTKTDGLNDLDSLQDVRSWATTLAMACSDIIAAERVARE